MAITFGTWGAGAHSYNSRTPIPSTISGPSGYTYLTTLGANIYASNNVKYIATGVKLYYKIEENSANTNYTLYLNVIHFGVACRANASADIINSSVQTNAGSSSQWGHSTIATVYINDIDTGDIELSGTGNTDRAYQYTSSKYIGSQTFSISISKSISDHISELTLAIVGKSVSEVPLTNYFITDQNQWERISRSTPQTLAFPHAAVGIAYGKRNGVWKEGITYAKYNGVWKPATATCVKQNGVWTQTS